jgi:hypothetical protein
MRIHIHIHMHKHTNKIAKPGGKRRRMSLYPGNPEPDWGPKKATKRYASQQPNANVQDTVLPGGMGLPGEDCQGFHKWEDVPEMTMEGGRVGAVERTVEWVDRFQGISRMLKPQ